MPDAAPSDRNGRNDRQVWECGSREGFRVAASGADAPGAIASTPDPPYTAVIFTNLRTSGDHGYEEMATRMDELAAQQPGYLGAESVRDAAGVGITVSYWSSLETIHAWKRHEEHLVAQHKGRTTWYAQHRLRVCKVERAASFPDENRWVASCRGSLSASLHTRC